MRPELTLANSKVGDQFGPSSSPSLSFILFSRVVLPSDLLCRPVWPWISNPSASWVLRLWDGRPVPLNVFRLGMEARALCMGGKHYANKLHPLTFVLYRDILNIYLTSDYMYTIFILLLIKCIGMCLHVGLCKWMWVPGGTRRGCWSSWSWSNRQSNLTTGYKSVGRLANALNHQAFSPNDSLTYQFFQLHMTPSQSRGKDLVKIGSHFPIGSLRCSEIRFVPPPPGLQS